MKSNNYPSTAAAPPAEFTADQEAQEINHLHAEAHAHAETAVKKAILVGQKLIAKKVSLAHGEWIPWVEQHLTFTDRQAATYMRLAANQKRVSDFGAESIREAVKLLVEPKEDPAPAVPGEKPVPASGAPDMWEPDPPDEYNNDPDLERQLAELATELQKKEERVDLLAHSIVDMEQQVKRLKGANENAEAELEGLRRLKEDKARVERTLKELQQLEERKQELFKDSESLQVAMGVLVRSRDFFTSECMQIPALHLRPGTVEAIRQDMAGLLELVQNWLDAMRKKFGVDWQDV